MPARSEEMIRAKVAAALRSYPGMRGSTVVAHRDSLGGTVLLAYVSLDPQDATTPGDLRRHLRDRIPGAEVAIMFVRLDSLPPLAHIVRRAA